ncbi:MAG: metalloregulator ArsR/SmtB family transcription factor [Gemmatimonadota bacterium]|nr:metalloregulator ArsR/SmtB family transcription factor [Gemmatimonadota bacterium]HEU4990727.1 metalloregulator ArsR/SmtB family transcription factor [Gemmatimonadaceae bacterium]
MRLLSQTFKALSDEARLEILALLFRHGELCACDVDATLDMDEDLANHHLRYLVAMGLVEARRDGAWMRYRIADHTGPEQQLVLEAARALLADVLVAATEKRYGQWMVRKAGAPPVSLTRGRG